MTDLPVPSFVERDLAVITADVLAKFEEETGRTLQPAQVERLLVDVLAYRESLVREAVQNAALQNLVAFAGYPMLDYLGEIVGAVRLAASAARCEIEFTLPVALLVDLVVPAGTRVQSADSLATFATDANLTIAAGDLTGTVDATCETLGAIGNGYAAGDITAILTPVAGVSGAENTEQTDGGADVEDDDRFRDRIRAAPQQFSVAGSAAAYRFHAMSVSADILDVSVLSPTPGLVRLHVLTTEGLPSSTLLSAIAEAVSGERVRPLTDTVQVVAPTEVNYTIDAEVSVYVDADLDTTIAAATAAAEAYAANRRSSLGLDIVPAQLIAAMMVPGVYQVTLTTPAYQSLATSEWANCTDVTIVTGVRAVG